MPVSGPGSCWCRICLSRLHVRRPSAVRRGWLVSGAVALLVAVILCICSRIGRSRRRHNGGRPSAHAIAWTGRMIIAYGLVGLGYMVPATFLPVMARDITHFAPGIRLELADLRRRSLHGAVAGRPVASAGFPAVGSGSRARWHWAWASSRRWSNRGWSGLRSPACSSGPPS